MRQTGGTMLVACKIVHLDPSWINLLLRALLYHRFADPNQAGWWRKQLEGYSRAHRVPFHQLVTLHKNFVRTGRLTEDFLRFVWRDVLANRQVFNRMVETMSTHGAMFTCDPSFGEKRELVVMARLPSAVGDETLAELIRLVRPVR